MVQLSMVNYLGSRKCMENHQKKHGFLKWFQYEVMVVHDLDDLGVPPWLRRPPFGGKTDPYPEWKKPMSFWFVFIYDK